MSKTDDLIKRAVYGKMVQDGRKKQTVQAEQCPALYEGDPSYPCSLPRGHKGLHQLPQDCLLIEQTGEPVAPAQKCPARYKDDPEIPCIYDKGHPGEHLWEVSALVKQQREE